MTLSSPLGIRGISSAWSAVILSDMSISDTTPISEYPSERAKACSALRGESLDLKGLSNYQTIATRTLDPDAHLAVIALGVGGEAGELLDVVKKHIGHSSGTKYGRDWAREKVADEMGDVLWYLSALASLLGLDLAGVAESNIRKLEARYPDGFERGGGNR